MITFMLQFVQFKLKFDSWSCSYCCRCSGHFSHGCNFSFLVMLLQLQCSCSCNCKSSSHCNWSCIANWIWSCGDICEQFLEVTVVIAVAIGIWFAVAAHGSVRQHFEFNQCYKSLKIFYATCCSCAVQNDKTITRTNLRSSTDVNMHLC